ncbi:O-antigen polysaccharide polymerase Wzy [Malikia granosa]|uniref:O-antigen polysaccharide polymerase Wzy n=1 Tax=Malikia granosa TaxID=263067 RepID=UPI0011B065B4|nr:O-antigen polysaccharide polymerase Wzy [Malikia granosa]
MNAAFCFFYAATQIKNCVTEKSFLFILMLISVFPTGVPRYMVAFAYIPLIIMLVPPMRKSSFFSAALIFSLIFMFPFLDQFRYFSNFSNINLLPSAEFFYAAHFDAYENFASAVEANFVTNGYQLLGSLFFFIPRLFWSSKPVGSGYEMAEQLGYVFNNVSMPLLGEGYVNFGLAGVLIFASITAYYMARIDKYFLNIKFIKSTSYHQILYYFLIGSLFFMLRGDLLSSTAYIIGSLFSWVIVKNFARYVNILKFSFK